MREEQPEERPEGQPAAPPSRFIRYRREQAPAVRIFAAVMGLVMLGPVSWNALQTGLVDPPLAMALVAAVFAVGSIVTVLLRRGMNAVGDAMFSAFVVFALAAAGWKAGSNEGVGLHREAFAIIALLGLGFAKLPTRLCALLAIPGVGVPVLSATLSATDGAPTLPPDYVLMMVPLLGGLAASLLMERADLLDWRLLRLHAARAARDDMTGVSNRLGLAQGFPAASAQARRERAPLTVALIDMDGLKPVNDTYGHAAGDEAILHVTDALKRVTRRPLDLLARFGGDEFVVVFYGITAVQAESLLQRARGWLRRHRLALEETAIELGFSAGLCEARPGAPMDLQDMLERADEALYRAKSEGRARSQFAARGPRTGGRRPRFISVN